MDDLKWMALIANNPSMIASVPHPSDDMKLLAINKNGLLLENIEYPTIEMQHSAIKNNPNAIKFIKNPSEEMSLLAIQGSWTSLEHIEHPTDQIIQLALEQSGWAIKFLKHQTEAYQRLAVRKNYDALQFIKAPFDSVQEAAVAIHYQALRYIKSPTRHAELIAIKQDESAIRLIEALDLEKMVRFLKANFLVIKYILSDMTEELYESVLKEVLSDENVEEGYVRAFVSYRTLEDSFINKVDPIKFIHQHGSLRAKRIAVDEKLKNK